MLIDDSALVTLDATTGEPRGKPVPVALPGVVEDLVPSPDGASAIALVGKPRARVISLASGERLGRVKHPRVVTDAAFSPDGRLVASSGRDWTGRVWSTRTWLEVREPLRGHNGQVLAVAFDRSGLRIATGSTDQTARVWRAGTSRPFTTLFGHTSYVDDVAFGPGGVLVTASGDGTARTWHADGVAARALRGHRGPVRKAEFAADGTVVTGGAGGTIRIWDSGTNIDLVRVPGVGGPTPARREAVSPDGTAGARIDGDVVLLRTASGERALEGHKDAVNSVSFSPDSRLLVSAGKRPRRDRVGRVDRRGGVPDRRGAVGHGRRRALQPGRTLARDCGTQVCAALDGGRARRAVPLRPESPLTAVAFEPARGRSSRASATMSSAPGPVRALRRPRRGAVRPGRVAAARDGTDFRVPRSKPATSTDRTVIPGNARGA